MIPRALCATVGALSHVFYFSRGEHHMYGALYIELLVTSVFVVISANYIYGSASFGESCRDVSMLLASFLGGLYSSLLIYRLFFHPLRKFKGPIGAKISSLWFPLQLKDSDCHWKLQKYHERYGTFVRIGSSDLSIAHPRAVNIIYGPRSKCTKADWYDLTQPMVSMQTTRDQALHDKRRRIWSTAFSDKTLRGYDARIEYYRQQFFRQISAFGSNPVNVTKWFNLFSFDVMGDLAFGASFRMLETTEEHWAIKLLNGGVRPLAFMLPTWFFRLAVAIPGLTRDWWRFITYCCERLNERMMTKSEIPDIMAALLEPHKYSSPSKSDLNMLQGDSQLIVVAGSDTTATTLTAVFYQLCKHPEYISRLRSEMAPFVEGDGNIDHVKIQHLDYLNAVIHEALRLHPPVPVALQRKTPPEGLMIDDTFIPGNMTVYCPQYVLGRSPSCFVHPLEFIPDRWCTRPELIRERSAFAPFSLGGYACIGRPLALMNVRMMVAKLLMRFDMALAPGEDGSRVEAESQVHFTTGLGPLNLVFHARKA